MAQNRQWHAHNIPKDIRQKQYGYKADNINTLKLSSNFYTRLAYNTLGKKKPKKSSQYSTVSIFLVTNNF